MEGILAHVDAVEWSLIIPLKPENVTVHAKTNLTPQNVIFRYGRYKAPDGLYSENTFTLLMQWAVSVQHHLSCQNLFFEQIQSILWLQSVVHRVTIRGCERMA